MIDPWFTNSSLDTCVLNSASLVEASAVKEILCLQNEMGLSLIVSHSTKREFDHPNTPREVKMETSSKTCTVPVELNPQEMTIKRKLHSLIVGNGKASTYAADAEHIFEAQKYGSYFLTEDRRLLGKAAAVQEICELIVLLPTDFLQLVKQNGPTKLAH